MTYIEMWVKFSSTKHCLHAKVHCSAQERFRCVIRRSYSENSNKAVAPLTVNTEAAELQPKPSDPRAALPQATKVWAGAASLYATPPPQTHTLSHRR